MGNGGLAAKGPDGSFTSVKDALLDHHPQLTNTSFGLPHNFTRRELCLRIKSIATCLSMGIALLVQAQAILRQPSK